jgi:hypothetical protein
LLAKVRITTSLLEALAVPEALLGRLVVLQGQVFLQALHLVEAHLTAPLAAVAVPVELFLAIVILLISIPVRVTAA